MSQNGVGDSAIQNNDVAVVQFNARRARGHLIRAPLVLVAFKARVLKRAPWRGLNSIAILLGVALSLTFISL